MRGRHAGVVQNSARQVHALFSLDRPRKAGGGPGACFTSTQVQITGCTGTQVGTLTHSRLIVLEMPAEGQVCQCTYLCTSKASNMYLCTGEASIAGQVDALVLVARRGELR